MTADFEKRDVRERKRPGEMEEIEKKKKKFYDTNDREEREKNSVFPTRSSNFFFFSFLELFKLGRASGDVFFSHSAHTMLHANTQPILVSPEPHQWLVH